MLFWKQKKAAFKGDGIIIFHDVSQAIQAEKIIKGAGHDAKLAAPPPELRKGCALGLEVSFVERAGIEQLLKERDAPYIGIFPLTRG